MCKGPKQSYWFKEMWVETTASDTRVPNSNSYTYSTICTIC